MDAVDRQLADEQSTGEEPKTLSRWLVLLFAVVVGAAVANIYYSQPLLPLIARDLGVAEAASGLLVTATQIGYALALALLVPLGDLWPRRSLVASLLALAAVGLGAAALAPGFVLLAVALTAVGFTSAVSQIVVPLAASLAREQDRGRTVGTVMSGLLIGLLIARTVAGALAALGGWRLIYVAAAVVMLLLAAAIRVVLPRTISTVSLTYPALLRSMVALVRSEPVLRQRMVLGFLGMGCFTTLWTALSFLLAGPDYGYGPETIGLFGLAGLAGALAAPTAGRLADHQRSYRVVIAALVVVCASWGLLALGQRSVALLVVGIVLLDMAQQTLQINNQSTIYARAPDARSRLTSTYVVSVFLGGTLSSAAVSLVYPLGGWLGVCVLGVSFPLASAAVWAVTERRLHHADRAAVRD